MRGSEGSTGLPSPVVPVATSATPSCGAGVGLALLVQLEDGVPEGEGAFKDGETVGLELSDGVTVLEGVTDDDTDGDSLPLLVLLKETRGTGEHDSLRVGVTLRDVLGEVLSLPDAVSEGVEDTVSDGVDETEGTGVLDLDPDMETEPETVMEDEGVRVTLKDMDGLDDALPLPVLVSDGVVDTVAVGVLDPDVETELDTLVDDEVDRVTLPDQDGLEEKLSLLDADPDGVEDIEGAGVVEGDALIEPEVLLEAEGDCVALKDVDEVPEALDVRLTVVEGVTEGELEGDAPMLSDAVGEGLGEGLALSLITVALVEPAGHTYPEAHGPVHPALPSAAVLP